MTAANKSQSSSISTYHDQTIEEYSNSLIDYQLNTKQLSSGFFRGRTTVINLGDISLTRRRADVGHYILGNAEHTHGFLFPLNNTSFYANGIVYDESKQAVFTGKKDFYSVMPEGLDHILVSIKADSLSKYLSDEDVATFVQMMKNSAEIEYNSYHKSMATQFIYQIYLRMFWNNDNEFQYYSSDNYCKFVILYLYEFLSFHRNKAINKNSNYEKILARAINFITSNNAKPIDLNELSSGIYASKRSIQYAFSKTIGMSPLQFMKNSRLNLIREEIKSSQNKLSEILNKYQITNHGRFSKEFSEFFEERPNLR